MGQPPLPPPRPPPAPPPPPLTGTPPPYLPPSPLSGTPQSESEIRTAEQKALWALILVIAGFVFCGLLYIPALILANQALAVLDRPEVESGSRGIASAARWLAIVGLVLLVLGALVWTGLIAVSMFRAGGIMSVP